MTDTPPIRWRASRERLPAGAEIVRMHTGDGPGYEWFTVAVVEPDGTVFFMGCDKKPPPELVHELKAAFPEARAFSMVRLKGGRYIRKEVKMHSLLTFKWVNDLFKTSRTHVICAIGVYISAALALWYFSQGDFFKFFVGTAFFGVYAAIGGLRAAITKIGGSA